MRVVAIVGFGGAADIDALLVNIESLKQEMVVCAANLQLIAQTTKFLVVKKEMLGFLCSAVRDCVLSLPRSYVPD